MALPVVALVGRPNVGKSTLFNRIVGGRRAVVSEREKTTRDRNYGEGEWQGRRFLLVDTGGFLPEREASSLDRLVVRQVQSAADEADVVLFLVDAKTGPLAVDLEMARDLRRRKAAVIVVVNKADNDRLRSELYTFLELGLGEPVAVSAAHGLGLDGLFERMAPHIPEREEPKAEETLRIGIVGRPNVGKSSLVNAYLGKDQMIVSDTPGTTRDSVDSVIRWRERKISLVDTAGIRRRSRVRDDVEYYSVLRALRSIHGSEVVFLLIDGNEPVGNQDARIASIADRLGRGIVVLLNKTDLPHEKTSEERKREVWERMPFLRYAPVLTISALTRKNIGKALDTAMAVAEEREKQIATSALNKLVEEAVHRNPPPSGRRGNQVYYAVQTAKAPPTFLFFVKDASAVTDAYRRYLIRSIREKHPYPGSPIRVRIREKT